jgi:hypothetical protein
MPFFGFPVEITPVLDPASVWNTSSKMPLCNWRGLPCFWQVGYERYGQRGCLESGIVVFANEYRVHVQEVIP